MKVMSEGIEGCNMFNSQYKTSRTDEYWLLLLLYKTQLNTMVLGSSLTTADGFLLSQISVIAQIKLYLFTSFVKLLPLSWVVVSFSSHTTTREFDTNHRYLINVYLILIVVRSA